MAYNRKNYLETVIIIQNITKQYQKIGLNNTTIFNKYIKVQFRISKRTFDEYLGIPAVRDLKRIEEAESNQLDMFKDV